MSEHAAIVTGASRGIGLALARALKDPDSRSRILAGLPDELLLTPISFVVDPFAHVIGTTEAQLRTELGTDKSLADIAVAHGKTRDELIAALTARDLGPAG